VHERVAVRLDALFRQGTDDPAYERKLELRGLCSGSSQYRMDSRNERVFEGGRGGGQPRHEEIY
jgi:hypothetical protein